jgi:glutaredoxin
MRASCIQHPPNEPLIIIHQWQLVFCEDDATTAALLSYFEYWHNVKLGNQANDTPNNIGLLQFHSEMELIEGIMKIATSRVKIKKGIDFLVNTGVISIHRNPKPRYGFDKTRHFWFHPDVINSWLEGYMAEKPHDSSLSKNRQWSSKYRPPSSINRQPSSINKPGSSKNKPQLSTNERAIPEITTEIATEISTEITSKTTTTTTAPQKFSGTDEKNRSSSSDNREVNRDLHQREGAQNENATNPPAAVESEQVNSGEYELIFDFALREFSPEQKQQAVEILKSIPKADRQSVLDEFNSAQSKNTIKSPWSYLSTLVKRYNADEFTPTSDLAILRANTTTDDKDTCPYCKNTGQIRFMRKDGTLTDLLVCQHGQQARAYIQKVKTDYGHDLVNKSTLPKNVPTIKDCPYCNERGMLDLRNRSSGKVDIRPCSHNPEKIKQFAREKNALIASAKPGFDKSPSLNSKKRGGGLRKLADVIGGLE